MTRVLRTSKAPQCVWMVALISACGGTTPSDVTGAMDDASAETESSSRAEPPSTEASTVGDELTAPDHRANLFDASNDVMDAGTARDGGSSVSAADASGHDSGPKPCIYSFEPDYQVCMTAGLISAEVPLTTQDTAQGARGDCAMHASGPGGKSRYYRFKLPAGRDTRVVATAQRDGGANAPCCSEPTPLIRVFSDCYAEWAETGARGFSDGTATVCVHNRMGDEREVIIAVAQYSGEPGLDITFDLTVTAMAQDQPCGW